MKLLALVLAVAAVALAGAAAAADTPIPLVASTGYRDFCDGLKQGTPVPRKVCPAGRVLGRFWRPLKLPSVQPGGRCPVSALRKISATTRGYGAGPVFISRSLPIRPIYPAPEYSYGAGSGWAVDKTPVVMAKKFHGPFLVRGGRIDGDGSLGFSGFAGRRPFSAMQFARGGGTLSLGNGIIGWGVILWMTSPGCYAMQIDTRTVSRVIVVRVEFRTAA